MTKKTATAEQPSLLIEQPTENAPPTAKAKPVARRQPQASQLPARAQNAPAATAGPPNMLAVIAQAAADPRTNPENMRALLDMSKEIAAEEGRMEFIAAFHRMQKQLPTINKDGKIEVRKKTSSGERDGPVQQTTKFSSYENIMEICKPIMDEFGFIFASAIEPAPDGARINVISYLDHVRGHQRLSRFPMTADVTGNKNNQQGWGSSQKYGMRYNAIALLNIISRAPQDRDTDGVVIDAKPTKASARAAAPQQQQPQDDGGFPGDRTISAEQCVQLMAAIEYCGVGLDKFCAKYQIAKVEELPETKLRLALKACADFASANGSR